MAVKMGITTMVITKVIYAVFSPRKPLAIMVDFFNDDGNNIGSQLFNMDCFNLEASEIEIGRRVYFKSPFEISISVPMVNSQSM